MMCEKGCLSALSTTVHAANCSGHAAVSSVPFETCRSTYRLCSSLHSWKHDYVQAVISTSFVE